MTKATKACANRHQRDSIGEWISSVAKEQAITWSKHYFDAVKTGNAEGIRPLGETAIKWQETLLLHVDSSSERASACRHLRNLLFPSASGRWRQFAAVSHAERVATLLANELRSEKDCSAALRYFLDVADAYQDLVEANVTNVMARLRAIGKERPDLARELLELMQGWRDEKERRRWSAGVTTQAIDVLSPALSG